MNKHIGSILIILMLITCQGGDNERNNLNKMMRQMQSRRISIPYDKMMMITNYMPSKKIVTEKEMDVGYHLIVYTDSTSCSPCTLKLLRNCHSLYTSDYDLLFDLVFIFAPVKSQINELVSTYRDLNIDQVIYIDTAGVFARLNPHIPNKGMFHTFMTDCDDSVVLVGDPARNKKVRELMYRIINN